MTKQEYFKLLDKYEAGLATQEEERLLYAYYNLFDLRKDGLQDLNELQRARLSSDIRKIIDERILAGASQHKQVKLWPRIAIAAAALAAITLGVWIYTSSINGRHPDAGQDPGSAQYANDIAPGKNTATLTLSNGRVISLDTSRTSVVVADSVKAMTTLTASTPRGGTYQVVLPDGTKVWLNADSKISFPSQFTGKERKILLSGEAYFEVSTSYKSVQGRRTKQSFIVSTENQDVTVLGTHFNVSSYKDQASTKTTLLEGSVEIAYAPRHPELVSGPRNRKTTIPENVVLKPNEQATLLNTGQLKVTEVDTDEAIAWKNGLFSYTSAPLDVVLKQVSRWYNVEVEYLNEASKSQTFTGSVSRYDNVSRLLKAIEYTGAVKFKIEGNKIIVTN